MTRLAQASYDPLRQTILIWSALLLGVACEDPGDSSPIQNHSSGSLSDTSPTLDGGTVHAEAAVNVSPSQREGGLGALPVHPDSSLNDGGPAARPHDASPRPDDATLAPDDSAIRDAHDSTPIEAGSACTVDACNDRGTCIQRDLWTECDCTPEGLTPCGTPSFRALGSSRTDRERVLHLISGDGRVVAGEHAFDQQSQIAVGVVWTAADGLRMLEQDPAGRTIPTGLNGDGSLIAGRVETEHGGEITVVWRDGELIRIDRDAGALPVGHRSAGVPDDGTAASRSFHVLDATEDGRVLVGKASRSERSSRNEAALWTESLGVVFLSDLLESLGVNMDHWVLWGVSAVSDDGTTMVGSGVGPDVGYRWYLQLPADALR